MIPARPGGAGLSPMVQGGCALEGVAPERIALSFDSTGPTPVDRAAQVIEAMLEGNPRDETAALVLADAALATSLGWTRSRRIRNVAHLKRVYPLQVAGQTEHHEPFGVRSAEAGQLFNPMQTLIQGVGVDTQFTRGFPGRAVLGNKG